MDSPRQEKPQAIVFFDVRRVIMLNGAANGLRGGSVQLLLSLSDRGERPVEALRRGLRAMGAVVGQTVQINEDPAPTNAEPVIADLCRQWLDLLSGALAEVSTALSVTVSGPPTVQKVEITKTDQAQKVPGALLQWPTRWPHLLAPVLNWALDQWTVLAQAMDQDAAVQEGRSSWQQQQKAVLQVLPSGTNAALLLTAADSLDLPMRWIGRDIMQFGHGRRARWLRSTMTDSTPSLGAMLARDKAHANRLLRMAGVPVPQHVEVMSEEGALAAAARLGWPVVVKPADQDAGAGARANLRSADQVAAAYRYASSVSRRVLVEQYIAGHDHRLTVVHGKLFWAYGLQRAMVVGDGKSVIQALIDAENERRRSALTGNMNDLQPIQLKPDDILFLEETNLPLDSIPAAGQEVWLQRLPNSHRGGLLRACFGRVHPDNRVLAERAAQLLRLDIAGVDLIIPDISRSWREVGGAITEVNAIPQVYNTTDRNLVARLLRELVPSHGRIPLAYVLVQGAAPAWVEALHARLAASGLRVGLSTENGLRVGADLIRQPRTSEWDDVQALQLDPTVEAIVVVGDGSGFLQSGLPFDAVDALVVSAHAPQVLQLMLPYCGSLKAVLGDEMIRQYGNGLRAQSGNWLVLTGDEQGEQHLVDEVVRALLAAEAVYTQAEPLLPDEVLTSPHHPRPALRPAGTGE